MPGCRDQIRKGSAPRAPEATSHISETAGPSGRTANQLRGHTSQGWHQENRKQVEPVVKKRKNFVTLLTFVAFARKRMNAEAADKLVGPLAEQEEPPDPLRVRVHNPE